MVLSYAINTLLKQFHMQPRSQVLLSCGGKTLVRRSLYAKLKLYLGRGGRGVRLKNYNLCFIHDFSVLVQCTQVNMMLVMLL